MKDGTVDANERSDPEEKVSSNVERPGRRGGTAYAADRKTHAERFRLAARQAVGERGVGAG